MKEIVHTVFIESQDEVLVNTVWSTQLLTATCEVDVLGLDLAILDVNLPKAQQASRIQRYPTQR
jgi:hypothetical protein